MTTHILHIPHSADHHQQQEWLLAVGYYRDSHYQHWQPQAAAEERDRSGLCSSSGESDERIRLLKVPLCCTASQTKGGDTGGKWMLQQVVTEAGEILTLNSNKDIKSIHLNIYIKLQIM